MELLALLYCDIPTDAANVPELVLLKQNSSEVLYCDGGRLSIHWRFRGRSLDRTQRRRLTCQTSCQCTLSVSPETVHTAGDYSCCVKKCDHFVCSSKTIAVQSRHGSNEPETTSVITGSFVIAQILLYLFPTCL